MEFIDAREPQPISYGFYIDEDAGRMTVVAVHPDSASLERHMDVGGAEFRPTLGLRGAIVECRRPSERALEQARNKAAALGDGGAVVSIGWFAGFAHVASVT